MLKKLAKTIFATTSILAGAAFSAASPSYASSSVTHLLSYSPEEITKVGVNSTGTAYEMTGLMDIAAEVKVHIYAGIAAHVKNWKVYLRIKTEDSFWVNFSDKGVSASYPALHRPQVVDANVPLAVPHMTLAPVMVGYCNAMADELRAQGTSNTEIFSQDRTVQVAINEVLTFDTIGLSLGELSQAGPIDFSSWPKFNLICKGRVPGPPVNTAGAFKPPPVDFKINDIDLFLSTYSNANTTSNHAVVASCKKGQIKVRLKASKAGPAKFKLWTQLGAAPMTSKVIDAWASFDGDGGYKAEHVEWVSVDTTTNLKAKAEEMVGLGLNTPWKEIKLLCSGSGATISQDTSDYEAKAVMALYDANAKDSRCPRTGHVGFTFSSNYSKPINYRLTSNTGIDKSGTVQLSKSGSEWKGLVTVPFPVDKNMGMGVVLRHIQNGVATIVATKTREYKCITPAVDTGSDDLVHGTIPVEPAIPPAKYDGKLTIADSVLVKSNRCPRQGQVVFKINSNNSAPVSYSLIGTNGQSWTGTLQMLSKGNGKYQGVGVKPFNILKTEKVTFVLKRVKDNKAYVLDFRARQFSCAKRIVNTGSNDLKPDSNQPSNSSTPELSQSLVVGTGTQNAPSAPWQCVGGTVKGHKGCVCPPHKKLIYTQVKHHGKLFNGSKCVLSGPGDKTTKPGVPTGQVPGVSILCKPGFELTGKRCVRKPVMGIIGVDKTKSDAVRRRLEAAKKAADAKRKREEAAAKALKLKAAQDAAIAKRKAAAIAVAKRKAVAIAVAKRNAAAALARRRSAVKKRSAPSTNNRVQQFRAIRRR